MKKVKVFLGILILAGILMSFKTYKLIEFNGVEFGGEKEMFSIKLKEAPSINTINVLDDAYELYLFKTVLKNGEKDEIEKEHYKKNEIDIDFFKKIKNTKQGRLVIESIQLKHKKTEDIIFYPGLIIEW